MTRPMLLPAGIDALLALWRKALPGVQILDGDPAQWPAKECLAVGTDGSGDPQSPQLPVAARPGAVNPSRGSRSETAQIPCLARCATGGTQPGPLRQATFDLFDRARLALDDDRRLGGLVSFVDIPSYSYGRLQNQRGTAAAVMFVVELTRL